MPIPGVIEPELVLVETGFLLGGLETLLDRPTRADDADHFRQPFLTRVVAVEVCDFAVSDVPAKHILVTALADDDRPVIDPETLCADPAGTTRPVVRFQRRGEVLDQGGATGRIGDAAGGHVGVFGNRHAIGDLPIFQEGAKPWVLTELLVGGEPGEWHARRDRPGDHGLDLLRTRLERQLIRDSGFPAPIEISAP